MRETDQKSMDFDLSLSDDVTFKARNLLLSTRESVALAEEPSEQPGFKRVGKALVSGMHQALFARRGSDRNQNLMKSLMAAISKEQAI